MKIIETSIPEVKVFEPKLFGDDRGFFFESFNQQTFQNAIGSEISFVQDNHSSSKKNVLRGLHYQIKQPQGKLVRVARGAIFDVAVDLRKSSPTLGQWVGAEISEDNHRQIWVPAGFGHGFLALSDEVEVLYKTTDYYAPEHERCVLWKDPQIGIEWPFDAEPILSEKDRQGVAFNEADLFQ